MNNLIFEKKCEKELYHYKNTIFNSSNKFLIVLNINNNLI